jgi:hypothetical protein
MARTYYFTNNGEPFSENAETGDDAVARGNAIKIDDVPDNIESWRLSINPETKELTVFGGADADEATAQAAKEQAQVDEDAAEKTKQDDLNKAAVAEAKRLSDAGLA